MSDKEYNECRIQINALVASWRKRLGLNDYTITLTFSRGFCQENPDRGAYTNVFWAYQDAEIIFYLEQLKDSYKSLEAIIVHELTHILLAPIASNLEPGFEQQHEFACENIARVFLKMTAIITTPILRSG